MPDQPDDQTLQSSYWQHRYEAGLTGWDAGAITTPLKDYFDQLTDKSIRILIPGAGNAYEAEYLFRNGFKNVTVVDVAPAPLANLKLRVPAFPAEQIRQENFFEHQGAYELIVEQTFFCALHPDQRERWTQKMLALLVPGGRVAGVLFDTHFEGGPPFGGDRESYRAMFAPHFTLHAFNTCYNSIPPRAGNELFIILRKPEYRERV